MAIGTNTTDLDYLDAPDQIVHLQPNAIPALLYKLRELKPDANDKGSAKGLAKTIDKAKLEQREDWLEHNSKRRVNPEVFFSALSKATSSNAIVVTDQGAHRALTAELLPINNPKGFVSPATLNAMGYCVPAVNAIKLANPDTEVIGIVGDGAMIINGMEALTAVREKLGAIYCLFNNSERTKEKNLGHINWGAFADALECGYFPITSNKGIDTILRRALKAADQGQPVILDIYIDYSRKSHYAQHREKAELARLPSRDKLSIVKRAIVRKIMGSIKQKDSV